jgi:hypothetical protein
VRGASGHSGINHCVHWRWSGPGNDGRSWGGKTRGLATPDLQQGSEIDSRIVATDQVEWLSLVAPPTGWLLFRPPVSFGGSGLTPRLWVEGAEEGGLRMGMPVGVPPRMCVEGEGKGQERGCVEEEGEGQERGVLEASSCWVPAGQLVTSLSG